MHPKNRILKRVKIVSCEISILTNDNKTMLNNYITTTKDIEVYLKVLSEKELNIRQLSLETFIKNINKNTMRDELISNESLETKSTEVFVYG